MYNIYNDLTIRPFMCVHVILAHVDSGVDFTYLKPIVSNGFYVTTNFRYAYGLIYYVKMD